MSRARLARTVLQLRPGQVAQRVRLRTQRRLLQRFPEPGRRLLAPPPIAASGWPAGFLPLDARDPALWCSSALLAEGRVSLLGTERALAVWREPDVPQLWRYHLHYWDWAWALTHDPDRLRARAVFRRLLRSWQEQTVFGRWDEWSPYVVSLRAWSWCGQFAPLVQGSDLEAEVLELLGLHARFLERHLELDAGGNHLVKNLKALVGLGVFLGDAGLQRRALERLRRAVRRQVLPDGGHEERAPAYHCQVLGDLVDLRDLLGPQTPGWLDDAVRRMRRWLGLVLLPDGRVPLLNDGFPVPAELIALLEPGPAAAQGLTVLRESGLAVLRRGDWHVLADVGLPCPRDLPAHAHADTLGFLLHDGAAPRVAERYTSTYAGADLRQQERGTAAHSTLQVDDEDSTEVWGAFRAGRRARPTLVSARTGDADVVLTARHDGYRHLPGSPVHERTWTLGDGGLTVDDVLTGSGTHDVALRLHDVRDLVVEATVPLQQRTGLYAEGWERRREGVLLEHQGRATLPWRARTTMTRTTVTRTTTTTEDDA